MLKILNDQVIYYSWAFLTERTHAFGTHSGLFESSKAPRIWTNPKICVDFKERSDWECTEGTSFTGSVLNSSEEFEKIWKQVETRSRSSKGRVKAGREH